MVRSIFVAVFSFCAVTFLPSCTTLPHQCEIPKDLCPSQKIAEAQAHCVGEMILVRPEVCTTYPFGGKYAGAFYCGENIFGPDGGTHLVEAWCKENK